MRPGEHERVVVRLVAVAIDEHDVAGLHQRLHHDLVRGRCAVGDEERLGARRTRVRPAPARVLIGPRGWSSESSPPLVAEVSARKMFAP